MKIVIIGSSSNYLSNILKRLYDYNISVEAVFLKRNYSKNIIKNLVYKFKMFIFTTVLKINNSKIYYYEDPNESKMEATLKSLVPDYIVLAGSGIIKSNILDIPLKGTLNAHPAILPNYRGVNVVEYTILNGDSLGATLHYVDEGIDTGEVISKFFLPKSQLVNYKQLKDLKKAIYSQCSILISHFLYKELYTQNASNQSKKLPYCTRMTSDQLQTIENLYKKMRENA